MTAVTPYESLVTRTTRDAFDDVSWARAIREPSITTGSAETAAPSNARREVRMAGCFM